MKWLKTTFSIIVFFSATIAQAQPLTLPLNQTFYFETERKLMDENNTSVSSFKPVLLTRTVDKENDSTYSLPVFDLNYQENRSFVARKLFYEHLIALDTGNIRLTIDPILNLELGDEQRDDPRDINLYKNTRGFNLNLSVGKQVAIGSSFRENQANLPLYLSDRVRATQVAYGQGRIKTFDQGFDFSMSSAYVSYSPSENINVQVGHGKHFLGSGHRSILLSDLSFNYPYLRFNTKWFKNKLHYQNVYALLQNMNRLPSSSLSENLFERKQATFHYLEYKAGKKLSIGLFEGIIYPGLDSSGNNPPSVNYWMPVIFLNSLIEAPNQKGNSMLGINLEYIPFKNVKLYQQLAVFDEDLQQFGFQSGFKYYLNHHFMIQGEVNNLDYNISENRFTHNNESLAHPFHEEVLEFLGIVQFQKNRWLSRLGAHQIDTENGEIQFVDLRQAYIINPSYNFTISLGAQYRQGDFSVNGLNNSNQSLYVYFGLSTNLQNLYFNY